ncbi:MAG TPA: alpha/beta fold hydrolase [Pseudonocardiaceae bacterium]|jgi:hypothetical protein|nr:alpha/beta fold hydrolase [Pseudonocardiaceae bacterium]
MRTRQFILETDRERIACTELSPDVRRARVLIMHGAGQANQRRYAEFAADLATEGLAVNTFDFSGHGESSGRLADLSLARRLRQAEAVLDAVNEERDPLMLMGFSMSGQTVCDLLAGGRHDVRAVVLGCPATYTPKVWELPFGQPEFTAELRRPESWRESTAFATLAAFPGRIVMLRPRVDEAIPPEVTEALLRSCPAERTEDIVLEDATHKIYDWMNRYPRERGSLAAKIAKLA